MSAVSQAPTWLRSPQSPSVLHKIALRCWERAQERKLKISSQEIEQLARHARTPRSVPALFSPSHQSGTLKTSGPKIIAEVKFASPSQGIYPLSQNLKPEDIAQDYLKNGATALSILTEVDHFHGNPQNLQTIRKHFPDACLLQKDFMVDSYQFFEARVWGADAVLLIVALLGKERTQEFLHLSRSLGLSALVEVHNQAELDLATWIGATWIGVNNRNLKDLSVSLETSFELAKKFKPLKSKSGSDLVLISESGIDTAEQLNALSHAGFDGFLIGTSFMKSGNPGSALAELRKKVMSVMS